MRSYIIRRILLMIPTVFIASLIVFIIIRSIPGSVVDYIVQNYEYVTHDDRVAVMKELGLDQPVLTQYFKWMDQIVIHGDLGNSMIRKSPIIDDLKERTPVTLELGLLGIIFAQLIAIPIGIYSAIRQDTIGDYIARTIAILAIALPGFWLATMVVVFPSLWWGYMPPLMYIPLGTNVAGNLQMFVIPALILGMGMAGTTMRMTRTMMLEVLRQDYVRTAWAKGLKERVVVLRHALKNALIPVITIIGWQIPSVLAGTVIIENIFGLPGIGQLLTTATQQRDYTVVSSVLFLFAVVMVVVNLLVDIGYAYLDPRVHYR